MKKLLLFILCVSIVQSSSAQNIGGIGAQLFLDTAEGYTMPRIQALIPNTPAYQYLNATDYIIKVDGTSCKDKPIADVVSLIRGEVGTTVKITVAGTKDGKNAKDMDLQRVGMQLPPGSTPDPGAAFNSDCENEVKQLRNKRLQIVKTYSSDCGDFFFNFNAESGTYHARLITMEEKGTGTYTPGFNATAKVFDGDNESTAVPLVKQGTKEGGNFVATTLEGTISFKKTSVGTISVQIHDDVKKCGKMYVIVYK